MSITKLVKIRMVVNEKYVWCFHPPLLTVLSGKATKKVNHLISMAFI